MSYMKELSILLEESQPRPSFVFVKVMGNTVVIRKIIKDGKVDLKAICWEQEAKKI